MEIEDQLRIACEQVDALKAELKREQEKNRCLEDQLHARVLDIERMQKEIEMLEEN
jgi:hypothetical protein